MRGNYRINESQAACDTIEGEMVFIDLVNNSYYSVTGSGGCIVEMLRRGYAVYEICDQFRAWDPKFTKTSVEQIESFVEILIDANLVIGQETTTAASKTEFELSTHFTEPKLEKFGDLPALLAFSPNLNLDSEVDASDMNDRKAA